MPGILFSLGYEREYTRIASFGFHERLAIFVGMSALFGVLSLPVIYQGYRVYVRTGAVRDGEPLPWWIWLAMIGHAVVPLLAGFGMGFAASRQTYMIGPDGVHFEDEGRPGQPIPRGIALLIRWDEVLYAEFIEA